MAADDQRSPAWNLADIVDELANALQVVVLYANGFEHALCETRWSDDAAGLMRATGRAASAAEELRKYAGRARLARMSIDVGAKAPDFTLVNQDRERVTLSAQLGKGPIVLAFFPAAFSGTCTKELCTIRDSLQRFSEVGATVLGISVDTFFTLNAFARDQHLTFPLLSDFNKEVIRQYGVFNEDMIGLKGIAKRAVFVLDKDGVVRHREILDDARNEPDYGKLTGAVEALR